MVPEIKGVLCLVTLEAMFGALYHELKHHGNTLRCKSVCFSKCKVVQSILILSCYHMIIDII